ncbi:hypothetical protein FQN57_005957 [Myotisia sp. PD_48]|nr:hypothetical protein FQN57_005957 [Myotisia sp. PD_48]
MADSSEHREEAVPVHGTDPGPGTVDKKHGSVSRYLSTRFSSLKPPMHKPPNPIAVLALPNLQQWLFFLVAFLAWTWDAFDFFTVSLTVHNLAKEFNRTNSDITWGITLVLMLRSIGAAVFGILSDRYGRKWPFVANNVLFIVLELATGLCQTYEQFLAVRALFGIAMGGMWGNAAATALEDCPAEARGLLSGMMQQGWAFGYLLATAFAQALVDTTPYGWRPYFWFAACPPVLLIIFRLCLPETQAYQNRMKARENGLVGETSITQNFIKEGKVTFKRHWILLIYLVLVMSGMNFISHGSQDLYPTLLHNEFGFDRTSVTVTQIVANIGAIIGGTTVGYLSQVFGRRLSLITACLLGAALLYPYTYVPNRKVAAAAFFEQFCVQGAWGIVPIYLLELAPGELRTFVVGVSYQLGNLISSASATIEAKLGERFPLPPRGDIKHRFQYGKVICIFMACVFLYTIVVVFLGPERFGHPLEAVEDTTIDGGVVEEKHGEESDVERGRH